MNTFKSIIIFSVIFKCYPVFCENLKVDQKNYRKPKVSIVLIIDQLSISYLQRLKPYLSAGLNFLAKNGIYFRNAFYEHSMPSTAVGHATLSTGTFANYHGVVHNRWFNSKGKKVKFEQDDTGNALVFSSKGLYDYGMSPKNLMVDTVADQLVLNSTPYNNYDVWALSLKPRAAIALAGRLGKAIWFDEQNGWFTSSKAYFDHIPTWLSKFNKDKSLDNIKCFEWKLSSQDENKYNLPFIDNYNWASAKPMVEKKHKINLKEKYPFEEFAKTPLADEYLLEVSKACINNYIDKFKDNDKLPNNNNLVLYVSLSVLDKIGHSYGPYSKEAIDAIYHLDNNIQKFIDYTYSKFSKDEVLFILSADHGVMPIPHLIKDFRLDLANIVNPITVKDKINSLIEFKYGIKNIITNFLEHQFYLDLEKLPKDIITNRKVLKDITNILESLPGVRSAWTFNELAKTVFDQTYNLDINIQRQLYKERSGQIFYSMMPYSYTSIYKKMQVGTSHASPYAYDTHVPLIFYQKGQLEKKDISQKVGMHQLAPTLSYILDMPRPSAAKSEILPGLFY